MSTHIARKSTAIPQSSESNGATENFTMSGNKTYHRLMGSSRWVRLRLEYLAKHPLCERCEAEGKTKLAKEVHHKIPIQHEVSEIRMRALAYDPNNLQSLCEECHHLTHEEMGSTHQWNRKKNKERAAKAVETFTNEWLK